MNFLVEKKGMAGKYLLTEMELRAYLQRNRVEPEVRDLVVHTVKLGGTYRFPRESGNVWDEAPISVLPVVGSRVAAMERVLSRSRDILMRLAEIVDEREKDFEVEVCEADECVWEIDELIGVLDNG